MAYQEDKQGKIKRQTSKQAIALAMEGRWQESVEINLGIIQSFPNDLEAYNRLGKAYVELGDYTRSKEAYNKALQLDQYNTIAKKNLERLEHLGDVNLPPHESVAEKASPDLFIEEIGKAGVVNLYQIASSEMLVKMMAGDKVVLKVQDTALVVESKNGEYLGTVPTKQAQRLIKLMSGGNQYTSAVVNSNGNAISVIIRETYQAPELIGQVSFPGRRLEEVQPFISERGLSSEYEEEELSEVVAFKEGEEESPDEVVEEVEEEKEWEQEA